MSRPSSVLPIVQYFARRGAAIVTPVGEPTGLVIGAEVRPPDINEGEPDFSVADGKITELRSYFPMLALVQQLTGVAATRT